MGLREHEPTIEYLMDLVTDVQTVRSCQTAAELDPEFATDGACIPGRAHVAAGSIAMQKARQRMAEILRILPGSSLVVAPSDKDLASPEVAAGLEESFGGGGYTALQRSALLQLAADHVASALDGRESAFELHANGGIVAWRARLRQCFSRYNELANGVLEALSLEMPAIDLDSPARGAAAAATPRHAHTQPPPGGLMRHLPRRLAVATVLVLLSAALAGPAAAAPEGTLTWGLHVTLAARWVDPVDTEAFINPFMVLYAVHDAAGEADAGGRQHTEPGRVVDARRRTG